MTRVCIGKDVFLPVLTLPLLHFEIVWAYGGPIPSVCLVKGSLRVRKVHSLSSRRRPGQTIDTAHTQREKNPDLTYVASPGGGHVAGLGYSENIDSR
jgi:hypothetical protein